MTVRSCNVEMSCTSGIWTQKAGSWKCNRYRSGSEFRVADDQGILCTEIHTLPFCFLLLIFFTTLQQTGVSVVELKGLEAQPFSEQTECIPVTEVMHG